MRVAKDGLEGDTATAVWRKSSRSGPYSDNCVEVAGLDSGLTVVRDSKAPDGPVLAFTPDEWDAFTAGAKLGEFDR